MDWLAFFSVIGVIAVFVVIEAVILILLYKLGIIK